MVVFAIQFTELKLLIRFTSFAKCVFLWFIATPRILYPTYNTHESVFSSFVFCILNENIYIFVYGLYIYIKVIYKLMLNEIPYLMRSNVFLFSCYHNFCYFLLMAKIIVKTFQVCEHFS